MSDQTVGGKPAPAPRIVSAEQAYEAARRKAKGRHISHYRDQVLAWSCVVALAAVSYPLQEFYRHYVLEDGSLALWPLRVGTLRYAGLFVPSLGFIWMLIANWLFLRDKAHDWNVAVSNAQQTISPQNVTKGYTDLFNLYMRTKRRSYLLAGVGLLAFVFAVGGFILNAKEGAPLAFWPVGLVETGLGVWLVRRGYKLGSTFLPGDVIVRHTLQLSIFAISNVTNVEDARLQAEKDAEQFVRDNPWWFYPG